MSSFEQIAKQAEADLNTYQAKTGNARAQGLDDAGVNSFAEKKFENASVEYGDELSTNAGYNKRIPPSEGGELDDRGRQTRGEHFEGQGGPEEKLARANYDAGGNNDNDVVPANITKVPGEASGSGDILTAGRAAAQSNVGRNPPGPGGSQFKGEDYYNPESVPDSISAEGNVAPESVTEASREAEGYENRRTELSLLRHTDTKVLLAFWLFGLINNVLYVIILSAAQDLVGSVPKGVVLLADVLPSFLTKLIAPYFIHRVPYSMRILAFIALSATGMFMVALTPPSQSVAVKMVGVVLASLSSGGGELSFLGLTHYYGHISLAGWGSGTGAAGLVGAGLYVTLTDWWGFSVRDSLLFSACLPAVMFLSFFVILPKEPLRQSYRPKDYDPIPEQALDQDDLDDVSPSAASSALLAPGPSVATTAYPHHHSGEANSLRANLKRAKALVIPYMMPLLLVYVAEYTINQGVAPTLLFPLASSPFKEYREFYPFYGFLYQLGVFISRSSISFFRTHHLYLPSLLQVANLSILTLHAMVFFIPSVYIVFLIIFWEGLLGGAVYVNCFAEIMENVPPEEREFSLGATSVSDSGGICIAGFIGIILEPGLCNYQVAHGRDWCKKISIQ
ncbi:Protein BTN1 [Paramyrothecium foliicola]|nr:Protein BTN1 [Paramyrothecium foliicola]